MILLFIDNVTAGTQSLVIVIIKSAPAMWSFSPINTQCPDHFKSSSTSHFLKGKLRDLQKLLRYLNEIVTYVFKGGIGSCGGCGSCGGWDLSGFGGGSARREGLASFFLIIFVLHSNKLPSEALSSTSSISYL